MLFHILSVSVGQKLLAPQKFEILGRSDSSEINWKLFTKKLLRETEGGITRKKYIPGENKRGKLTKDEKIAGEDYFENKKTNTNNMEFVTLKIQNVKKLTSRFLLSKSELRANGEKLFSGKERRWKSVCKINLIFWVGGLRREEKEQTCYKKITMGDRR